MVDQFKFEISLTVLNHLGRQLYRNFITILGEAISNSWDADAHNVWIEIDRKANTMSVLDDGIGMSADDLQNRFLKIGYSKRKDSSKAKTAGGRPYIGAKGIGKLALLSCAQQVSVASKTKITSTVGCLIDNGRLDEAIAEDLEPQGFDLSPPAPQADELLKKVDAGTALYFQKVNASPNTIEFLRRALALYYRFSLVDSEFTIHLNGQSISVVDLKGLAEKTEFVWKTEGFEDPFLKMTADTSLNELDVGKGTGFIASVSKPRDLEIYGAGERIGIDLFVNGRLRERDLLKRFPTARVPEQYMYGQIHLDILDTGTNDPFTSSREGIVEGNAEFEDFMGRLQAQMRKIVDDWDRLRIAKRQPGDPDNERRTPAERAAATLADETVKRISPRPGRATRVMTDILGDVAQGAEAAGNEYVKLYVLENVFRRMLTAANAELPEEAKKEVDELRNGIRARLQNADIAFDPRLNTGDLWYIEIGPLVKLMDDYYTINKRLNFAVNKNELTLLRNIVMHTADLTAEGKTRLSSVIDNLEAKTKIAVETDRSAP